MCSPSMKGLIIKTIKLNCYNININFGSIEYRNKVRNKIIDKNTWRITFF